MDICSGLNSFKYENGYFSSVWPYPVKNGHQKRIFSKNVFQGGDFSKRRGFAVLVTYVWKKTEVIEKRLRHGTLRAGGFSLAWLLALRCRSRRLPVA